MILETKNSLLVKLRKHTRSKGAGKKVRFIHKKFQNIYLFLNSTNK